MRSSSSMTRIVSRIRTSPAKLYHTPCSSLSDRPKEPPRSGRLLDSHNATIPKLRQLDGGSSRLEFALRILGRFLRRSFQHFRIGCLCQILSILQPE